MERLPRLIALLTMLQSRKVLTAAQMAERFDVSVRTIYRDLRVLEEAGIPIGAEAGEGYFLADGYRLPPLQVSEMEAFAILIANTLLQRHGDQSVKEAFSSLSDKVSNLLPSDQKERLGQLDLKMGTSLPSRNKKEAQLLKIQKAIVEYQVLHLKYLDSAGKWSERDVEPLGLYFTVESWVMVAHCRLRKDEREFRVDRIQEILEKDEHFALRPFALQRYFQKKQESHL